MFQHLIVLLREGVEMFAEGQDAVTYRVTSKRAPKGIAPARKSLALFDRLSKS